MVKYKGTTRRWQDSRVEGMVVRKEGGFWQVCNDMRSVHHSEEIDSPVKNSMVWFNVPKLTSLDYLLFDLIHCRSVSFRAIFTGKFRCEGRHRVSRSTVVIKFTRLAMNSSISSAPFSASLYRRIQSTILRPAHCASCAVRFDNSYHTTQPFLNK